MPRHALVLDHENDYRRLLFVDDNAENITQRYLKDIGQYPLLSHEEEISLAREMQAGNNRARERFIQSNLRLVVAIARQYAGRPGVDLLDLIQEGNLGLLRAVERFDPCKGWRFATYATWWIRQAVSRSLPDQYRFMRLPVHVNEKLRKLNKLKVAFEIEHGREPDHAELAAISGFSVETITEYAVWDLETISLDKTQTDTENSSLAEILEDPTNLFELVDEQLFNEYIKQALARLSFREREIIILRYGLDSRGTMTLDELAKMFGISRERIRQIEVNVLAKELKRLLKREVEV